MQFEIGCLEEMTDDNLKEISATLITRIKEAKKKVAVCLKKDQSLMTLWVTKLGVDPPKALPEEVVEIRSQRKKAFEVALLANPEAFVAFQVNTMLVQLYDLFRTERLRRAPVKPAKP